MKQSRTRGHTGNWLLLLLLLFLLVAFGSCCSRQVCTACSRIKCGQALIERSLHCCVQLTLLRLAQRLTNLHDVPTLNLSSVDERLWYNWIK
jgi:hypothetical protein